MKLHLERQTLSTTHNNRRGTVIILCVVMMLITLGIAAFTVDFGVVNVTKGQIQNAADSAAHAALQSLSQGLGPGATMTSSQAATAAGSKSQALVSSFRSGDVSSTQLVPSRDMRFGRRSWNASTNQWVKEWEVQPFNMVEVTVRRTQAAGTPLGSIFSSVFGFRSFDLEAKSVASLAPVTGFELPSTSSTETIDLLPFTVDLTTWNNLVNANLATNTNAGGSSGGNTGGFPDLHSFTNGTVSSGADGIRELNIFPDANTSLPSGNRGTVDLGSPNNSTNDLKRQIVNGLNAYDLSFFPNNRIQFNSSGTLTLNGDTGISAGIESSLQSIVGHVRAIPIFTSVSGPGNNAQFVIVRFVGIRVMAVKLTGGPTQRYLRVQPALFSTRHGIRGTDSTAVDMVVSQPLLIE